MEKLVVFMLCIGIIAALTTAVVLQSRSADTLAQPPAPSVAKSSQGFVGAVVPPSSTGRVMLQVVE